MTEQSKEKKTQQKNKGSVFFAESAYKAQNTQFGLVMKALKFSLWIKKFWYELKT